MKKIILFISTFVMSHPAWSADQFAKFYTLSEDVRDIILKADGHPMPNQEFKLNTLQSDEMKALASLDDSMRIHLETSKDNVDCNQNPTGAIPSQKELVALQKRVNERDFQIEAVVLSSSTKYDQLALGRFMGDDYLNTLSQMRMAGNEKAVDIYTIDILTQKYKLANPKVKFDSLGFAEKEETLRNFAETYLGTKIPDGVLMKEMAFQNMITNTGDWKKTLEIAKSKLSNEQKVQLVSKLGGYFSSLYNDERNNAGEKARGTFIDTKMLLDSVKNGTPGGICRDIALAQTQFLEELGFKQNYVVAYQTLGGRHATVISVDPDTKKIIKFNYSDAKSVKQGAGTEALNQDNSIPSMGVNFKIYDSKGKPVTKVSSELSQMLKSTTGPDTTRDFNAKNYSIAKVGFQTAGIEGNLFTGKTSSGQTLYGVAVFSSTQVNDYINMNVGAAYAKLSGTNSLARLDQDSLYARAAIELTSPSVSIGPVKTNLIAGAEGLALISNNKSSSLSSNDVTAPKRQVDADGDLYLGVQSKYETSDKKTSIDNKVYANFYPDWNHVAEGSKTVAVLDSVVVQTGVTHQISDNTKALVDTAVLLRNYGTSIVIKAILEDDKNRMKYSAGVAAPVTKDIPTFLPGGERRVMASVEKETPNLIFSIEIQRNLDSKTQSFRKS